MPSSLPPESAALASVLLARLRGLDTDFPLSDPAAIAEHLTDDPHGPALVDAIVRAHGVVTEGRLDAALAADRVTIRLEDKTQLPLDQAERVLAEKEQKRPYPPLRDRIANALNAERFDATADFDASLNALGLSSAAGLPDVPDAAARLRSFLDATAGVGEAALDALASDGGASIESPAALSRALDLPSEAGAFGHAFATTLTRAAAAAAGAQLTRPLVRARAPRDLCGVVISAAPGSVRVLEAPSLRAARFASVLHGGAMGIALSVVGQAELSEVPGSVLLDDSARLFGTALALGLMHPVVRSAFDEARPKAQKAARILRCRLLLMARATASATASALEETEEPEFLREAVASSLGVDAGAHFAPSLLQPPWPGPIRLRARLASAGASVMGLLAAATLAEGLRDRFDEAYPLVPAPYALLARSKAALTSGEVSPLMLGDRETPDVNALIRFVAELL